VHVSTLLFSAGLVLAHVSGFPQDDGPTHIGTPAGTLGGHARPTDVAFAPDGNLIVLDAAHRALSIHLRDEAGTLALESHPVLATKSIDAVLPSGVAAPAGMGPVWCDAEDHMVWGHLVSPDGIVATHGSGPDGVHAPEGVAVDDAGKRVAVADTGNRRVLVFDVGRRGPARLVIAEARLVRPVDVGFLPPSAALPEGGLAVLDADTSRVELYDLAGTWRGGFGDWGYFPGLFAAPQGLATWRDEIYVADTDNHRVQVFAPKVGAELVYELQYAWGRHAIRPGDGDGLLHYPTDVAVAPDGSFAAVCEPLDGRVQLFRRAPGKEPPEDPLRVGIGQAAAHYGRVADIDGQFMALAEPESRRVKLYDLRLDEPAEIGITGGHGDRLGMLMRPSGLALHGATRELLVSDAALRRLARVRLDIDPAETLRYDYARETWVEAIEFALLGPNVLEPDTRIIEPWEVDRTPDGGAVLVDGANGRVLLLGPDLLPSRVLLGRRDHAVSPVDVAVAPDGAHVWVADAGGGALFRVALATPTEGAAPHLLRVVLGAGPSTSKDPRPAARPMNLTVAPDGRVFVSDVLTHSIRVVVTENGEPREVEVIGAGTRAAVTALGDDAWLTRRGLEPLWFCEPADLGFDARGRLLVIDHGNHRGVIFDAEGNVALGFGSRLYIEALDPRRKR
jgi:DNA-binding beta-propeller fold protein YncE